LHAREGDHGGKAERLADVEGDQRLAHEVVGLRDHEVHALLDRPSDLLLVLRAHDRARGVGFTRIERPGVADVARHERAALRSHLVGDPHRLAVHGLQVAVTAHIGELLPVRVVGQRHHDVGAGPQELPVQLADGVRLIQDDFGNERARLDVAAPLELEDVALGADHDAVRQALGEGPLRWTAHAT
jgi:hypothetical protein